jgi:hypothetical protein
VSSLEENNIANNGKYTKKSTINRRYSQSSEGFAQCPTINQISNYIRVIDCISLFLFIFVFSIFPTAFISFTCDLFLLLYC